MEGFPAHYISHNLPFVVLFGLGSTDITLCDPIEESYPLLQEKGIYVSSDLPNVIGPAADDLLNCFHDFDAKDAAWNNRPGKGKMGTTGFTYRTVGRAFTLPARKAKPPSSMPSPATEDDLPRRPSLTPVLHSPLSPLSPDSPTYPDGIMTPLWFSKHQWLLPSTLISFFNFSVDTTSTTLQDNKLKSEINALKTSLGASSYKIRFVVVLVAEGDDLDGSFNDRLGTVRRGTSMDSKSLFLIPARLSTLETQALVGTILASIQPSCMEYYRDLSKHARRKRNRGNVPPPTAPPVYGTSHLLSPQGWNVRYETKLGFFAEFRQEMDAAGRNYEAAYEFLLDGDVFESIANWSPRFDETRLLADTLAIRILRCLLWTGQTTAAVQSWSNHRARLQDLVDRKGKGSGTYGWEAWEARWSSIMAELIEKVDVPIFQIPQNPKLQPQGASAEVIPDVYAIPEKAYAADDLLPPWDLLHHEGYWLRRAAQRTRARRKLAMAIPKEDRNSPGASPASQISSKVHLYDTYLCPEPHKEYGLPGHASFDHGALLVQTLDKAMGHFAKRHQDRAVERLKFEMAREYMRSGLWEDAMNILKPLWQKLSWRREGWWKLVEEISWAVRACARHLGEGGTLVKVEWELLSSCLTPRTNWQYDISKCLDGLDIEDKPLAVMNFKSTAPCLSAIFTFGAREGRVGEIVTAQLTIASQAHDTSAAILLSEVTIAFEGGLKDIVLNHNPASISIASTSQESTLLYDISHYTSSASVQASLSAPDIAGEESSGSKNSPSPGISTDEGTMAGFADLRFAPGMTKVFTFTMVPRDAGQIRAMKATLKLREELFDLDIVVPFEETRSRRDWWLQEESKMVRRRLDLEHPSSMKILPKPPKLRIELPNLRKAYYADEEIEIEIFIINDEEDEAEVRMNAQFVGISDKVPHIRWASVPRAYNVVQHDPGGSSSVSVEESPSVISPSLLLGQIAPSVTLSRFLLFRAPPDVAGHTLDLKAHYHIASDPQTSILKSLTTDLTFIMPFKADYRLTPLVDSAPFPNYFHLDDELADGRRPSGLKQQWSIAAKITSYAMEPLVFHAIKIKITSAPGGTKCTTMEGTSEYQKNEIFRPLQTINLRYDLEIQKLNIEDRRSSTIESLLEVFYSLESQPRQWNRFTINVPPLVVLFGEPRVIATATAIIFETAHGTENQLRQADLVYTLENPSAHLLDFMVTMEASEDFAFSGPKTMAVQMSPMSKYSIAYRLQKTNNKDIVRPNLKVADIGFDQILKVQAGEGSDSDNNGLFLYFISNREGSTKRVGESNIETAAASKQVTQTPGEMGARTAGIGLRRSTRGSLRGLLSFKAEDDEKKKKRSIVYF